MDDRTREVLLHLDKAIREVGGDTAVLLELLDDTSEAHQTINLLDSILPDWEDAIGDLLKHL